MITGINIPSALRDNFQSRHQPRYVSISESQIPICFAQGIIRLTVSDASRFIRSQQSQYKNTLTKYFLLNNITTLMSGRNSVVECQLPKLDVAGSSPVARSNETPISKAYNLKVTIGALKFVSCSETQIS